MLGKLREGATGVIEECDLFCSPITLRYKNDNDFKTLTGGVCSLFLICLFVTVFYNKFMSCINMEHVNASITIVEERDASLYNATTSEFMFVVGLDTIDMNNGPQYFTVALDRISIINKVRITKRIQLVQCVRSDWEKLGPKFALYYDNMNFERMLCPASQQFFELQGTYSSDIFRYFKLTLVKCAGSNCRSDAEVTDFVKKNDFFKLNFYYSTWLLNPELLQAATLKLDDSTYMQFNPQLGVSTNLFFESFKINTNYGLTPIDDYKEQLGMLPRSVEMRPYFPQNELVKLYLRKANTFRTIERSFTKFDELLSYIGGLFGMILVVVAIPLKYYNVCCYELSLATGLFTINKPKPIDSSTGITPGDQPPPKADCLKPRVRRFNFFVYLAYLPYFCIKKLGADNLKIQFLQPYYESIQVLRTQIDISHILRKFIFLDRVSKTVLDEHQRDLLYIIEKEDIEDIKHELSKARIHKDLKQGLVNKATLQPQAEIIGQSKQLDVQLGIDQRTSELNPPNTRREKKPSLIRRQSEFRLAYKSIFDKADTNIINRRILERMDRNIIQVLEEGILEGQDNTDYVIHPSQQLRGSSIHNKHNHVTFAELTQVAAEAREHDDMSQSSGSDPKTEKAVRESIPVQPPSPDQNEIPESPDALHNFKRTSSRRSISRNVQELRTRTQEADPVCEEVSDCALENL